MHTHIYLVCVVFIQLYAGVSVHFDDVLILLCIKIINNTIYNNIMHTTSVLEY